MFKPSLCRYNLRSLMTLDIPLRKTKAKKLILLKAKNMVENRP